MELDLILKLKVHSSVNLRIYEINFSHETKATQWEHPRSGKRKQIKGGKCAVFTMSDRSSITKGVISILYIYICHQINVTGPLDTAVCDKIILDPM